jgi:hypothetical protein
MSYVTTAPAALSAAATQLEGVGTSFATESAGAASATTAIAPAAADEVSILQSGVFSTYGQLYQTASAQAQSVHQQFVNALQQSSGSYQETEAANQAGAAANSLSGASGAASKSAQTSGPITNLINSLTSFLTTGPVSSVLNNNLFGVSYDEVGNFASGYSDLIGMGGGGLLAALAAPSTASADLGGLGAGLVGDVGPAAAVGSGMGGGVSAMGAAPVLAGVGSGSSIGAMSVPPSWAGGAAALPTASTPVTLAAQSWTTAAPTAGGMGPIAGMPAVANGGRGGVGGFGAPRYGVKPKIMPAIPKPTLN